jgi:hypothetical protein
MKMARLTALRTGRLYPRKYSSYSFLISHYFLKQPEYYYIRNLGASIFWNPQGLTRPVMGLLYLLSSTGNRINQTTAASFHTLFNSFFDNHPVHSTVYTLSLWKFLLS